MENSEIKKHRIVSSLPSGPIATNKLAINESSKAFVRIKIIPKAIFPPYTNFKAIINQFIVQKTFSDSSYLSKVLDFYEDKDNIYTFTDYHNDSFLSEMIPNEGFSEGKSLGVVLDILQGLKALHENAAMHSNLKPANIQKRGKRYVLEDWGIWAISALTDLKENSINYRAPEVLKDEEFDDKVDIWALGTILFEMLVGKQLFSASNPENTKEQILNFASLDFDQYKVKVSPECKELLERMLQPDPNKRISWVEISEHQAFRTKDIKLEGFDQDLKIYDARNVNLRSTSRFYQEINKGKNTTSIAMSKNQLSLQGNDFIDDDLKFDSGDDLSDDEASKKKKPHTENLFNLKAEAEEFYQQRLEEQKQTEKMIQGLEKRYLFIRNMPIFIAKIVSEIIKRGNGFIPIIWMFVVCVKKIHLTFKNLFPKIKLINFFNFKDTKTFNFFKQSHFFKEFLLLLFEDLEHFEAVVQSNIMDLKELPEQDQKNYLNALNYLTESIEDQDALFMIFVKDFIAKKESYLQALVKCGNNMSRENIELYIAFFFDCLKWQEVLKFDEEENLGFNLEDYDQKLRSEKPENISKKIQEDGEALMKKGKILDFDFSFLNYEEEKV